MITTILILSGFLTIILYYVRSKMQNGELIVIASGNLEIKLKKKPLKTKVKFKDLIQIPCNPGNNDNLNYKIIKKNNSFYLYIEWNVSTLRKIIWEVSF